MVGTKNIQNQEKGISPKYRPLFFVLFVVAFISSLYQIFLIKQLSITNALNSQTITINIVIALTLASLGFGAYLIKFLKKIRISFLLIILGVLLIFANIFMLRYDFGMLSITNIPVLALVFIVFSLPMIVMGVIFAKTYLFCIKKKADEKDAFKSSGIGLIVFTHTLGFILGALASILFIRISGANMLLIPGIFFIIILLIYLRITKLRINKPLRYVNALFGIIILAVLVLLICFYNLTDMDYRIEKQRKAEYRLWPASTNHDFETQTYQAYQGYDIIGKEVSEKGNEYLHLYSGWSPYSKIDIFSYDKECIGGAYNYKQQWMTCPNISYEFDLRQLLYQQLEGRVLLIGAGGGMGCLTLDLYNKTKLTCVEIDPLVIGLMKTKFQKFNNGIYNKVDTRAIDGRFFLDSTKEKFGYIIYEGTDFTVQTRIKSLIEVEDYLYTYEGMKKSMDLIGNKGGLLIIHTAESLPFEKLKKTMKLLGINDNEYLYYDFTTQEPIRFGGKLIFISKDQEKVSLFKEKLENNTHTFKQTSFDPGQDYPLVTDNKPFLYLRSNSQINPFFYTLVMLLAISLLIVLFKKHRINSFYFLVLGVSLVLVELFIITVLRSFFFDYITTYVIANSIIMISFSLGSLFYQKIKKIILVFPIIAIVFFIMITNINYAWPFMLKLVYLIIALAPLFLILGSYFPTALNKITKKHFPAMYLLDSLGSAIGFFLFYTIAIIIGIKYNFIIAAILYIILSLVVVKKFR